MTRILIGPVLSRSLTCLKDNFGAFFAIAALMKVISVLLTFLFGIHDQIMTPEALNAASGGPVAIYAKVLVAAIAPTMLALGMICIGTVAYLQGNPTTVGDCIRSGLRRAVPLILLGLLSTIGGSIGLMFFLIPGLFLLTIWFVAGPVMMVEELGVIAAMKRSATLSKGSRMGIFGLMVLIFAGSSFVAIILLNLIGGLGIVGDVILIGADALILAFSCVVCTIAYMNLRTG